MDRPDSYEKIIERIFNILGKFTSNYEDRQDLTQIVAMKYHLNQDKVESGKLGNWLYTTAKNSFIDFMRKQKRDITRQAIDFELVENQITESVLNEDREDPEEILKRYAADLSTPERELLELYIEHSGKIKKMARRKKIGYQALKKKVYRLKTDLKAKHNLDSGMIASREIIGAKLHENLINFLKKFRQSLEENEFGRMSIYLRDCEIPAEVNQIRISTVLQYDVQYLSDNRFRLLVPYRNENGEEEVFQTIFVIYNENAIKIVEFPQKPKYFRIDIDKLPPEYRKLLKRGKDGRYELNNVDIAELEKLRDQLSRKD